MRIRKLVQNGAMASRTSAGRQRAGARVIAWASGKAMIKVMTVAIAARRSDERQAAR